MTSQIVVLCEDQKMATFATRFLRKRYKYESNDLRVVMSPSGKGSGEQAVREAFSKELVSVRARKVKSKDAALVVMTDADKLTVKERIAQLDQALLPVTRSPDDPVLMIVPRRNIETWLVYLSGGDVEETTDYKHHSKADCVTNEQIKALVEMCELQRFRQPAPSSLQMACEQLSQLPRRS